MSKCGHQHVLLVETGDARKLEWFPGDKGKQAHRAYIKAARVTNPSDAVSLYYCMPKLENDDCCDPFGVPSEYKWFNSVWDAEYADEVEKEIRAEMETLSLQITLPLEATNE